MKQSGMALLALFALSLCGCGDSRPKGPAESWKAESFRLLSAGKPSEALPAAKAGLAIAQQHNGQDSEEAADCWVGLGRILAAIGKNQEAVEAFDRAVALRQKAQVKGQPVAMPLLYSAKACVQAGKLNLAEERYLRGIQAFNDAGIENSADCLSAGVDLAALQIKRGELDQATDFLQVALKACRAEPEVAPMAFCNALNNIGEIHYLRGEYEDALKYYKEALERAEAKLPGNQEVLVVYRQNVVNASSKLKPK